MAHSSMPRPKSDNDAALNLLLPSAWLDDAQELAGELSRPGASLTRADALRMAIRRGIDVLRTELHGKAPSERSLKAPSERNIKKR
jgi:hypothetical protein